MKKLIEYDGKVYQISKVQYDMLMDKQSNIYISQELMFRREY